MPNIWAIDSDKEKEADKKADAEDDKEDTDKAKPQVFGPVVGEDEDELEKPSFLRRLKRNKNNAKKDEKAADKSDK